MTPTPVLCIGRTSLTALSATLPCTSCDSFKTAQELLRANKFQLIILNLVGSAPLSHTVSADLQKLREAHQSLNDFPPLVLVVSTSSPEARQLAQDCHAIAVYEWPSDQQLLVSLVSHFSGKDDQLLQLQALADSLPQIVWTAKNDGKVVFFNRRWSEYAGFSEGDLDNANWSEALHPDDRSETYQKFQEAQSKGQVFENEYRLQNRDGVYRWFLGRAAPLKKGDGESTLWFGSATDIDDQKRSADAQRFLAEITSTLAKSLNYKETLEQVAKLAVPTLADWCSIEVIEKEGPTQVAVAHPDPAMLEYAQVLRREYPADWTRSSGVPQVVRTGISELYSDVPREILRASCVDERHFELLDHLGMRSVMIVPLIARDKTLGAISLVSTQKGRRYDKDNLAFAEEVGRRAGIAVDNARLYEQSQKAILMRDEFLSIASHEFKTPLTSLKLQLQIFSRQLDRKDEGVLNVENVKRINEISQRQINQLTHLVEDMLDVTRIESGNLPFQFRHCDLGELTIAVSQSFEMQFEEAEVPFDVNIAKGLVINCDSYRMEQVLTNLLTNALKYGQKKPVSLLVHEENNCAIIEVTDQGIGLSEADIHRIFGRFERAVSANKISGLGLGLYIARQIIEAHGGRIEVKSAPGKGSRFIVSLPLAR